MFCPLARAMRQVGAILILLTIEMFALSSSAFLLGDQLRPPNLALSFQIRQRPHSRDKNSLYVLADVTDTGVEPTVEPSEKYIFGGNETMHVLTFRSSFKRQSKPYAQLSPNIKLDEFLLHTDHLLNAGKSVHSKLVPKTAELLEEWTVACDRVGACPPNLHHGVIMAVRTAGISIPGLKVEWSAYIGTSLVHSKHEQNPELEFVLIKDESKVSSGAKPIVWLFNKLTKKRNNESSNGSKRRTGAMDTKLFTRLGFYKERSLPATRTSQENSNGSSESLVMRCAGTMEMKFRIPSMLGKFMFSSVEQKAKAERRVSSLITRQIEKDQKQNLICWEENFRRWIANTNSCCSSASLLDE